MLYANFKDKMSFFFWTKISTCSSTSTRLVKHWDLLSHFHCTPGANPTLSFLDFWIQHWRELLMIHSSVTVHSGAHSQHSSQATWQCHHGFCSNLCLISCKSYFKPLLFTLPLLLGWKFLAVLSHHPQDVSARRFITWLRGNHVLHLCLRLIILHTL